MSADDSRSKLEELLRGPQHPIEARVAAAEDLLKLSRESARIALLEVAVDEDENETMAREAGILLGRVYFEDGNLEGAPLHDFSAAAYLGFDDQVADLQRRDAP